MCSFHVLCLLVALVVCGIATPVTKEDNGSDPVPGNHLSTVALSDQDKRLRSFPARDEPVTTTDVLLTIGVLIAIVAIFAIVIVVAYIRRDLFTCLSYDQRYK
ncbi:hypothetical protein QR680_010263 [Steinernema hermaphroditum]|uniref:Uncharacterized protein n=1 Tax=Steinernema hermaphroditum TaxID=289476 RepID=A0AA39IND1_9BILA|nr:hypothetical protein QR680_010263 [Steinernema hermaphroditum]